MFHYYYHTVLNFEQNTTYLTETKQNQYLFLHVYDDLKDYVELRKNSETWSEERLLRKGVHYWSICLEKGSLSERLVICSDCLSEDLTTWAPATDLTQTWKKSISWIFVDTRIPGRGRIWNAERLLGIYFYTGLGGFKNSCSWQQKGPSDP